MSAIAAIPAVASATPARAPRQRTEVVVAGGGVRVSGHLTALGADLLRGAVESLHRDGQRTVRVDLHDVRAADDEGLRLLAELRAELSDDGGRLMLLRAGALALR